MFRFLFSFNGNTFLSPYLNQQACVVEAYAWVSKLTNTTVVNSASFTDGEALGNTAIKALLTPIPNLDSKL